LLTITAVRNLGRRKLVLTLIILKVLPKPIASKKKVKTTRL